jgi:hypothetical protein
MYKFNDFYQQEYLGLSPRPHLEGDTGRNCTSDTMRRRLLLYQLDQRSPDIVIKILYLSGQLSSPGTRL